MDQTALPLRLNITVNPGGGFNGQMLTVWAWLSPINTSSPFYGWDGFMPPLVASPNHLISNVTTGLIGFFIVGNAVNNSVACNCSVILNYPSTVTSYENVLNIVVGGSSPLYPFPLIPYNVTVNDLDDLNFIDPCIATTNWQGGPPLGCSSANPHSLYCCTRQKVLYQSECGKVLNAVNQLCGVGPWDPFVYTNGGTYPSTCPTTGCQARTSFSFRKKN